MNQLSKITEMGNFCYQYCFAGNKLLNNWIRLCEII